MVVFLLTIYRQYSKTHTLLYHTSFCCQWRAQGKTFKRHSTSLLNGVKTFKDSIFCCWYPSYGKVLLKSSCPVSFLWHHRIDGKSHFHWTNSLLICFVIWLQTSRYPKWCQFFLFSNAAIKRTLWLWLDLWQIFSFLEYLDYFWISFLWERQQGPPEAIKLSWAVVWMKGALLQKVQRFRLMLPLPWGLYDFECSQSNYPASFCFHQNWGASMLHRSINLYEKWETW